MRNHPSPGRVRKDSSGLQAWLKHGPGETLTQAHKIAVPTAFLREPVCEGTVRGPVVSGPEVRGHTGRAPSRETTHARIQPLLQCVPPRHTVGSPCL